MGRPQENPAAAFTAPYSPISERQNEGFSDYGEGEPPSAGCLGRFCCWWEHDIGTGSSHNHLLQGGAATAVHGDSWPVAELKKLREYSEMVAGPKWKNFIRRIGRQFNPKGQGQEQGTTAQFQYSPDSYALNFAGEDGTLLHSFSSRYASHTLINDQQRGAAAL